MDWRETGRREDSRCACSVFIFAVCSLLLIALGVVATVTGVKGVTFDALPQLIQAGNDDVVIYTIRDVRLPRVLLAVLLGAALATAGCLLQGITRNSLADPEIIGVNQGASLFVVLALVLFGDKDAAVFILIAAFLGAAAGGSIVYSLALQGNYTRARLVLAGIAVSFFMGSMTTGIIVLRETDLFEILYWMAGKLSGAAWMDVKIALGVIIPALIIGCILSNQFNILTLGEEVAQGLGQNIQRVRRIAGFLIVILVGGSVALAGPIGFVGLIVPHIARGLVGKDYRVVLPLSALLGANLLLLADVGGQWVLYPADTPVGIITALLGTPFFLYLMRARREIGQ